MTCPRCPVCDELVDPQKPFFDTPDGIAHEQCMMRDRHVEHEETTRIVVDVSCPMCPECTDGIDPDGERCSRCGGTADPARPFVVPPRIKPLYPSANMARIIPPIGTLPRIKKGSDDG